MRDKNEELSIEAFALKNGLKFAVFFGSRVNGTASESSDYDVALLYDEPSDFFNKYDEALDVISRELNAPKEKIDLADLGRENILLRYNVTKRGKLLYGNRQNYNEYCAFSFREYHDAKALFGLERRIVESRQVKLNQIIASL